MRIWKIHFAALLFLLVGLSEAVAESKKTQQETGYDKAIQLLTSSITWCQGAALLTHLGKPEAVIPLLIAYESRSETDKLCLLEAMSDLDHAGNAKLLAASKDPKQRRMGAHLMELFIDEHNLPLLEPLCADTDPMVRYQAIGAIANQKQTPAWESTMIMLLPSEYIEVRERAVKSLSRRHTEEARNALRDRLDIETDPYILEDIKKAIGE